MTQKALRDPEAAKYLGVSVSFLKRSRLEGKSKTRTPGPPYVKVGRIVRYLVDDLDQWLLEHRYNISEGVEV